MVGVEHYVGDPYETLNVNVNGTQNILKAAYKYNKKVVFSSTSEVYGRNPKVPWREDDDRVLGATTIDRWCYSTSKAVGEHFCFAYHKLGCRSRWCAISISMGRGSTRSTSADCSRSSWDSFCAAPI